MTDQAVQPVSGQIDLADVERRIKAIFIGSVGNLVKWYDFYAYTAFALYFAPAFFPNSDPVVQQLNAAVLFAATFLMRPLGGWLFGFIADRYGRRLSLTLSVVCMCFGSLIIAVTPTYASIGITVSVFGGTAPAVALYFKSLGHEDWFYYYLSGMIFLSLIIYSTMRDTKHESAMHRHE
jgi:MFS family permease